MPLHFAIRALRPSDTNHILSSWLRAFRANAAGGWPSFVPATIYYDRHRRLVERVLGPETVRVAYPTDEDGCEDVICGWACVERGDAGTTPDIVHFVNVKPAYREQGVARALLADVSEDAHYTHKTHNAVDITRAGKLPRGWVFDPYPFLSPE